MKKPPPSTARFWKVARLATRVNNFLFRRSKGRLGGRIMGAPVLLLDHVGRRSGTARTTPLIYVDDAPRLVIVASKGGTDDHPAWFHNLMAMDSTEVELPGGVRRRVRARVAAGDERESLWTRAVGVYPPYAEYATFTDREIPVIVLEPA
jgi:F420H(2)-dependent quinone reductase